MIETKVNLVD